MSISIVFDSGVLLRDARVRMQESGVQSHDSGVRPLEQAIQLLEKNGFDYDLVEDLKGYVVQLPKHAKYAQILKNSVAFKETANERLFLMKDLAAVEEAAGLGAKIVEAEKIKSQLFSLSLWMAIIVWADSWAFSAS